MSVVAIIVLQIQLLAPSAFSAPQSERSWKDFEPEANAAWKSLRDRSKRLSFKKEEQSSIDGGPFIGDGSEFANVREGDLQGFKRDSKKESVAVAVSDFGFIVKRRNDSEPWNVFYYGPSAVQVRGIAADTFGRNTCPPLTPSSSVTFEELIALEGVSVARVEETGTGKDLRVAVSLSFPDQPLTVKGSTFDFRKMLYEFAPGHHWVVTKHDVTMANLETSCKVTYKFDEDGWPIPTETETKVVVGGRTRISRETFSDYRYECDDAAFLPETYGLPPFHPSTSRGKGASYIWWIAAAVVSVLLGLWLKSRAKKVI